MPPYMRSPYQDFDYLPPMTPGSAESVFGMGPHPYTDNATMRGDRPNGSRRRRRRHPGPRGFPPEDMTDGASIPESEPHESIRRGPRQADRPEVVPDDLESLTDYGDAPPAGSNVQHAGRQERAGGRNGSEQPTYDTKGDEPGTRRPGSAHHQGRRSPRPYARSSPRGPDTPVDPPPPYSPRSPNPRANPFRRRTPRSPNPTPSFPGRRTPRAPSPPPDFSRRHAPRAPSPPPSFHERRTPRSANPARDYRRQPAPRTPINPAMLHFTDRRKSAVCACATWDRHELPHIVQNEHVMLAAKECLEATGRTECTQEELLQYLVPGPDGKLFMPGVPYPRHHRRF